MVQPLAARILLPIFGGTSSVWTASMMFFQVALLLGYLYAHGLRTWFRPRTTLVIHLTAIGVSILFLDLDLLKSGQATEALAITVSKELWLALGIPFVFLSASTPLIQAWQSVSHESSETYRLYACSNAGSLVALIGYPLLIERLGIGLQSGIFRFGLAGLVLLTAISGIQIFKFTTWTTSKSSDSESLEKHSIGPMIVAAWFLAAATASGLLISTTNVLCKEVASYPFLWVLPLTLYLLSFIVCFERPAWYQREIFIILFAISIYAAIVLLHLGPNAGLVLQVAGFGSVVFFGAMICHGELYLWKPPTQWLTLFYLIIASGGATGSAIVTLVAPNIFNHYFEFHLSLFCCLLVPGMAIAFDYVVRNKSSSQMPSFGKMYVVILVAMTGAMPVICSWYFLSSPILQPHQIVRWRNEYGIVSVSEDDQYRKMFNGQTNHGGQFLDSNKQLQPNAYYSKGSGADVAFHLARQNKKNLNVCVIGLGTGSMLSYGTEKDEFRFYEINALSVDAARQYFTYLDHQNAEIVVGDGRLQMEKENLEGLDHRFDIIFVDAFTSDSIPVHLLTQECIDLYLRNLAEDGILVFHITNKFVDLMPVIESIKTENELEPLFVRHENRDFDIATKWVLMAKNHIPFDSEYVEAYTQPWPKKIKPIRWTDDYSSVAPLVTWSQQLDY